MIGHTQWSLLEGKHKVIKTKLSRYSGKFLFETLQLSLSTKFLVFYDVISGIYIRVKKLENCFKFVNFTINVAFLAH